MNSTLFDSVEAQRLKTVGIDLAASKAEREQLLVIARLTAKEICLARGTATSDDVARVMLLGGHDYARLGNASGAVFQSGFKWTGQVTTSVRVSTHGRIIRVWSMQ